MANILAILAKGKPKSMGGKPSYGSDRPDESEETEAPGTAEESESTEDEYADTLGEILGVSEDDMADFKDALSGYVRACVAKDAG